MECPLHTGRLAEVSKPRICRRTIHKVLYGYVICLSPDTNECYLDGPLVLQNLSFDIKSGEHIGIGNTKALEFWSVG